MSDLEQLKREQERTNFWLAFIAGSMVSVPAWLSGAIDVALVVIVVVSLVFLACIYVWVEIMDRSWSLLFWCLLWIVLISGAFMFPGKSHAEGAMFWDSNGNYLGQALPAGPNAVQVYGAGGEYRGQVLKSGPNAVQFYDGNGNYSGQAIGTGPKGGDALSGVNPNASMKELSGINPNASLEELSGMQ